MPRRSGNDIVEDDEILADIEEISCDDSTWKSSGRVGYNESKCLSFVFPAPQNGHSDFGRSGRVLQWNKNKRIMKTLPNSLSRHCEGKFEEK